MGGALAKPIIHAPNLLGEPNKSSHLYDAVFLTTTTTTLTTAITIAAGTFLWPTLLFFTAMNAISLATGRACLRLPIPTFRTTAEYIFGALLLSLLTLILCLVFTLSAGPAALIAAVIGLAISWRASPPAAPKTTTTELALTLLACLATLIWSWQAILAVPHLLKNHIFTAWTDYFIHAGEISQFASFHALHGTTIFASGAPLPPYHYASYMLPAALAGLTNVLALTAITAFWTPFGVLLMALACIVLGGVLAGERGGILALIAVFLIPSASHYALRNPFFDFHWLIEISTSAGYAFASAVLSLTAFIFWHRHKNPSHLIWMAALTLATALFRVHIFAPLALTNAMMVFAAWRPQRRWAWPACLAASLAAAAAAAAAAETLPRAPHLFTFPHHPVAELLTMLGMTPSPSANLFQNLAAADPNIALATGLALLTAAAFGLFLPLYLITLFRRPVTTESLESFIPLVALAAYLAIVIIVPNNPPEPLEFAHRPFVFVYALLAIWSAAFIAKKLPAHRLTTPLTLAAGFILLATPLALQSTAQKSNLTVAKLFYGPTIPPGLIATAAYLRAHTTQNTVIAAPQSPLDEPLIALTQRPEFFPGTLFLYLQSGLSPADQAARQKTQSTSQTISWLVTFPPTKPPQNAAFTDSGFAAQQILPK